MPILGGSSGGPSAQVFPYRAEINPFMTPDSNVGWNDPVTGASYVAGGYTQSSSTQNDEVTWLVMLAAGTWQFEMMAPTTTDAGIASVYLDGVQVGTIDLYSAALQKNVRQALTGIAVTADGSHTLRLAMEDKNAASSAYRGYLTWATLTRTGS